MGGEVNPPQGKPRSRQLEIRHTHIVSPGVSRAGTPISSSKEPIGSSWSLTQTTVVSSGPHESGLAPSFWRARSSGRGDARTPTSRFSRGAGSHPRSAKRWRRRLPRCRCPVSDRVSESAGTTEDRSRYHVSDAEPAAFSIASTTASTAIPASSMSSSCDRPLTAIDPTTVPATTTGTPPPQPI
jgi:hypothetical protein